MKIGMLSLATSLALCWFLAVPLQAEEGQYRSRILVTPLGQISKGAELTAEELERQIGEIEDPYARSSAGRHLARHYVARGDYNKAIEYYRSALDTAGLSAIANREMLRELARVYLVQKDYTGAVQPLEQVLAIDLQGDAADYLLLAQARYHLSDYVALVATLDRMKAQDLPLDLAQTKQALALYYGAGAYQQCEQLLQSLLTQEPAEPRHWHLLASVYLQQGKQRQALDQLTLAREKSVPFSARDILLLSDLQALHNNPYGAAATLRDALADGELDATGDHYRKLFEFWYQARESGHAQDALARAAELSGDTELYLYLAQLQMDQQDWPSMNQTMHKACARQLADSYVGRANLLLGVSQLKLGRKAEARRSFINATLIGGANAQAGQWLDFMDAEPATDDELRRIVSLCYGQNDKRGVAVASDSAQPAVAAAQKGRDEIVNVKTAPAMSLFYSERRDSLQGMSSALRGIALKTNIELLKAGGSADGPLHLIFDSTQSQADERLSWRVGIPVGGAVSARGRFRVAVQPAFPCVFQSFAGSPDQFPQVLDNLLDAAANAGYELTGHGRIVMPDDGFEEPSQLEIQLEYRP